MAKNKTPTTPAVDSTSPVVHSLTFLGDLTAGYVALHVISQGQTCLGFKPLMNEPMGWEYALTQLKISSAHLYLNRHAFKEGVSVPEGLLPVKGVLHTIGVARSPDGKYMPFSLKIEDGTIVKQLPLFNGALPLHEAFGVYKTRFFSFFTQRKLFIE
jgi:hypothetical protein